MTVLTVRMKLLLAVGFAMLAGLPPAHAAQQITQKETEGQSVELSNLDEPETTADTAGAAATAEGQANEAGALSSDGTPGDKAGVAAAKAVKETAMERYRDLRLQQAATPNTANPASGRRYLKVDRETYMESAGLQ